MNSKFRLALRAAVTSVAASFALGQPALAQDKYPERPIKIVVPWAAGSGIDVQTRAFAQAFSEQIGAPVIIENKSGAASLLGYEYALQAKPDGYTLFAGSNAQFMHYYMRGNGKNDLLTSMEPVTMMFWLPQVLVVSRNSPAKDVPGLIALAKASPGKLNYGSGGIGSGSHVLASAIATRNKLDVVHVPMRTLAADVAPMLERGDIHFSLPIASIVAAGINQGTMRALAVTSRTRLPQMPQVPTLAETLKSDRYAVDSWTGLFAPAGTPAPIVQKVYEAAAKAVHGKQHLAASETLLTPVASSKSTEDFRSFLKAESVKWADIVRDSGAKLD
jgi:tripartite-type tricarboxylate transporter receptor subunit TctC